MTEYVKDYSPPTVLITTTDITVTKIEIYLNCGFTDYFDFCRTYYSTFGISTSGTKKQNRH